MLRWIKKLTEAGQYNCSADRDIMTVVIMVSDDRRTRTEDTPLSCA